MIPIKFDSKINWYDQLLTKESEYDNFYGEKKFLSTTFNDVYEYNSSSDTLRENDIKTWYFNYKHGFIGYQKNSGESYVLKR